jgi:DNA-binding LytR/AlgR family response regulator
MSALKILIVEDDLLLAEELQEQLLEFGYTITDVVANSQDALLAFRRRLPDLVLCDIHLKDSTMDGIALATAFQEIESVPLIYLTAFGDKKTVDRANATKPSYYLIKPCNPLQLQVAIDLAISNFTQKKEADPQHSLQFHQPPPCALYSTQDFFFIKEGYRYVRIEISDIVYVEALGSNVKIITEHCKVVLTANLSSFSQQVDHPSLVRVHRSYLINLHKVHSFDAGRVFLAYQGNLQEIPVSKKYREAMQSRLPRLKSD